MFTYKKNLFQKLEGGWRVPPFPPPLAPFHSQLSFSSQFLSSLSDNLAKKKFQILIKNKQASLLSLYCGPWYAEFSFYFLTCGLSWIYSTTRMIKDIRLAFLDMGQEWIKGEKRAQLGIFGMEMMVSSTMHLEAYGFSFMWNVIYGQR